MAEWLGMITFQKLDKNFYFKYISLKCPGPKSLHQITESLKAVESQRLH